MDKKVEEIIKNLINEIGVESEYNVKVASGSAANTKGSAGFQTSPWELEELIDKSWECIVILDYNVQKFSARAVMRLLGIDKSAIIRVDSEVQSISKVINLVKKLDEFYQKDPTILEHIGTSISEAILGSFNLSAYMFSKGRPVYENLELTNNQALYSLLGYPMYYREYNEPLKIGTNENEVTATQLMDLSLHSSLVDECWFHHAMDRINSLTYCKHLNSVIKQIAYSERVYSKNESMTYLLHNDHKYAFTQLIERPSGQKAYSGTPSFKYKYTDTLERILASSVEYFLSLELDLSIIEPKESDLVISAEILKEINHRDRYILLNHLTGKDQNDNYVIDNTSTIKDEQLSRVYSLMTTVKSKTRTDLGFINYDISTCMQTIVAHFVDMNKYPMHQALIDDKRTFRKTLMEELDKDYPKIKEILSAADNGKKYDSYCKTSDTLAKYIEEADILVDEFTSSIESTNNEMFLRAHAFAKKEFEEVWEDNEETGKKELKLIDVGYKKYSVFFFIWTQIEREIRDAMKSCFDGFVHEVHDAVYSEEEVPLVVLERAVHKKTNLKVKIEH